MNDLRKSTLLFEESFGVDAGNVSAIDAKLIEEFGGDPSGGHIVNLHKGRYLVALFIDDSWNGPVSVIRDIEVPSGRLYIGDACYAWSGKDRIAWHEFLVATDHLWKALPGFMSLNTGGDGQFQTHVIIQRIGEKVEEETPPEAAISK